MLRPLRLLRSAGRRAVGVAVAAVVLSIATACGGGGSDKPPPAAVTLATALKLQQAGQLNQAKQLYEQVVKVQPKNVFAQYDLGVIAQQQGDNATALADYGAALAANPRYVPALYNQATIYGATDPPLAISTYRHIIVLQPVAPTALLNLGLLEVKQGEPKRGVDDLASAVAQDGTLLAQIPKHLQALVSAVAPTSTSTSSPPPTSTTTSTP